MLLRSTPLLAHTNPWRVSVITRSPRRRRTRTGLVLDGCLVRQRVVGIDLDHTILGLADDLLGDDEHVAVEQRPVRFGGARRGDDVAELIAGMDLPDARDRPDRQSVHGTSQPTAARQLRASAAADRGRPSRVDVTTQRTPAASTRSTRSASARRSRGSSTPTHTARPRRRRAPRGRAPSSNRSAGPFSAAPATIGETATTESRRAVERRVRPRGMARSGPIDTIGFDGAISTSVGGSSTSRPLAADPVAPVEAHRRRRRRSDGARTKYSWKPISSPAASPSAAAGDGRPSWRPGRRSSAGAVRRRPRRSRSLR